MLNMQSRFFLTLATFISLSLLIACGNDAGSDDVDEQQTADVEEAPVDNWAEEPEDNAVPVVRMTEGQSIWRGLVDNYGVEWSDSDLVVFRVAPEQEALFSAGRNARTMFEQEWASWQGDDNGMGDEFFCEYSRDIKLLSVVGPIISYRTGTYINCYGTAHPSSYTDFMAFDARKSSESHTPSLTDYFPKDAILKALLGDKVVKEALSEMEAGTPGTLDELVSKLSTWMSKCEYSFPEDFLTRFAFWEVKGDKVAVRIGLPHGCEAARGNLTQLGIWLPIPKDLSEAFANAADKEAGILMKDLSKSANDRSTVIAKTYSRSNNGQ
jgi:hypothetical protein